MTAAAKEATATGALSQPAMQAHLDGVLARTGSHAAALAELRHWSEAAGYFAHLTQPNEYLTFDDAELGVPVRLQINYSRLAYKGADAPRPGEGGRPACVLCWENIGAPGKELLRAWELRLADALYFVHLTPFPLHPGHYVANTRRHEPMRIGEAALRETAALLDALPGWLAASNSDVEWAGASVLGHHHVQLFEATRLPIEEAHVRGAQHEAPGVRAAMLTWYGPAARISGEREAVLRAATRLVETWKAREPGKTTCNYLMRNPDSTNIVMTIIFRHPAFRTPEDLRAIKSEGVGIVEMAGEVIVPPLADRDRTGNRAWFEAEGPRLVRGIVGGNSPRGDDLTPAYFDKLLARALA